MANDTQYPSYATCVAEILSQSEAPLTVDTLVARIERQRPVGSGVRSAVYQAISKLYQAVPVAPGRFGWLSTLLKDQRFRHPISRYESKKGNLLLDELEHAVFFPQFFQAHQPDMRVVTIDLMGGPTLQAYAAIEQDTWSLRLGQDFVDWVDQIGGSAQDDLLIWVKDATTGDYGMRLQPRESRQEALIQERNVLLAQTAEEIVQGDRKSRSAIPVWELAAALIGRQIFSTDVPPDDMHFVLHDSGRLHLIDDAGYTVRRQIGSSGSVPSRNRRSSIRSEPPTWNEKESLAGIWPDEYLEPYLDEEILFGSDDSDLNEFESYLEFPDDTADACEAFQAYLAEHQELLPDELPLSHMEFHLLEAELEMLVGLEQEFGFLMTEQEERKMELADRLFIDPNFLFGGDWDQDDFDEPPFWGN